VAAGHQSACWLHASDSGPASGPPHLTTDRKETP
jgi:hypothetical protein